MRWLPNRKASTGRAGFNIVSADRPGEDIRQAQSHFRVDIQLLRAWAVLSVMLNHARLPFLPGGFLGVDIFFVISGYLMTGIIDQALATGTFSFRDFYVRRARRLLPAAYCTLTVTACAAPFLLDATEYHGFVRQLIGAFTFTANIILWKQVDYFGTLGAMKPLLHIWSLSLEEQYYLLLPFLLFFCPRRFRLPLCMAMVLTSGALCVILMMRSPSAAFYMLPTRAWELGIGSIIVLLVRRNLLRSAPSVLRWICVAILLLVPVLVGEDGHPGVSALIVCTATAILLIPGAALEGMRRTLSPFVAIGDRSYSLYLVHWPLLAFASNIFLQATPIWVNCLLLVVGVLLSELQYRLIEQRFRAFAINWRTFAILLLLPGGLIGASALTAHRMETPDMHMRAGGMGLSPLCDFKGDFEPIRECASRPSASILVWGDSFAMALAPGVAATSSSGIVQATRTVCGPFLGLAPIDKRMYSPIWARSCIGFNASVIRYVASNPHIDTIVLTSALAQYISGAEPGMDWHYLFETPSGFVERPQDSFLLLSSLKRTVTTLRGMGKHVVMMAPPPASLTDTARCHERLSEHKPIIPGNTGCAISKADYHSYRHDILRFLKDVREQNVVPLIDFDARLCRDDMCMTRLNGVMLYRDYAHLSGPGSIALGQDMGWQSLIAKTAR
jgi:peptidoglycan/LPS O-acetylase OafA/YrhL